MLERRPRWFRSRRYNLRACRKLLFLALSVLAARGATPGAAQQTLANDQLSLTVGTNGEITSLTLAGDAFPTNYVMNGANARGQNTADHAWVGELMLTYRTAGGPWTPALTSQSSDVRKIAKTGDTITVSYEGASGAQGIRGFKLVESYALDTATPGAVRWSIELTNTGTAPLEIGDLGLPLPFNEYWAARDVIYEARTMYHSFTGQNSSYITVSRPSGVGPFLLMIPDATTGAGFEYMDNWRKEEHPDSAWAAGGGTPAWSNGLDVFYIHSAAIKSTGRGYLPNTSLMLAPGEAKTYAFKFLKVASQSDVKEALYREGLIDVTVVPGMVVASDMTAKFDLHTHKPIVMVSAQYPTETTLTPLTHPDPDHHVYALSLQHLGQNDITVSYGNGEQTTLQFYAIEPIAAAIARHATFMVEHTQSNDMSDPLYKVFDDWMMDTKSRRGATGSWGWGDDWGWTHGQFLAEKNAQTPVASEVSALDDYLNAVWGTQIDSQTYAVNDWFCPPPASPSCVYDRPFAYPHVFNTYFSMYKIAHLYPQLIEYRESADTYLMRAYNVLHALYNGRGDPGTGYMGEQTLPDIIAALREAGHTSEASFVTNIVTRLYAAFKSSAYPYGSEYNYDNTGEEAVYMAAKWSGDQKVLDKVNTKTRACRGLEPVWYYYADPVTLNGENWWQFQYSVSLIGYCMDDWLRAYSPTPELDERLSYAAKIANINAINSGQIDPAPENLGTVAWTYQAMKGSVYVGKPDQGMLRNGWRLMSGEADLGLFGALRILSSDVAVDPLFGLYCYGCEVAQTDECYSVVPKDGVFKRLNLITEHVHVELDRDRITAATLGTQADYVALELQNQARDAHMTKLTLQGLRAGDYPVVVDGKSAGMVSATADKPSLLTLSLSADVEHAVQVGTRCAAVAPGTWPAAGSGGPAGPGAAAGGGGPAQSPSAGKGTASAPTAGAMATATAGRGAAAGARAAGGAGTGATASGLTGVTTDPQGQASTSAAQSGCSCHVLTTSNTFPTRGWLSTLALCVIFRARIRRRSVPKV